jgi:hypothetical protein
MNNAGTLVFSGIVPTDKGVRIESETYTGLGAGIFRADRQNHITPVVVPGDPAPGGSYFDYARTPWINDAGDIAFAVHVAGEPCISFAPQSVFIGCLENLYVKDAARGEVRLVARRGDPRPGGGTYRYLFSPLINNAGAVSFMESDISPDGFVFGTGVFLHQRGKIAPIALPGDVMPGGGRMMGAGPVINAYDHTTSGDVSFDALLDTDEDGDGQPDSGLYIWSGGSLRVVARTGTVTPRGNIAGLQPPCGCPVSYSGAKMNESGTVAFQATLTDGTGVLISASRKR